MKTQKIAGIDYSLTSPAVTIYHGNRWNYNDVEHYCIANNTSQMGRWSAIQNVKVTLYESWTDALERYEFLADWVIHNLLYANFNKTVNIPYDKPDLVVLEDYAYAATGRVFHIAENMAILKYKLKKHGVKYIIVPPTVIKKFATGKGTANKELMYQNFCEETETEINLTISPKSDTIKNPTSDIVDSYYICKYGYNNLTITK